MSSQIRDHLISPEGSQNETNTFIELISHIRNYSVSPEGAAFSLPGPEEYEENICYNYRIKCMVSSLYKAI